MRIAFLLVTFFFLLAGNPFCSCLELNSLNSEEYDNYDLIVQGVVTSIEVTENDLKTINLEIKEVYKGELIEKSVKIGTAKRLSYCGLNIGIYDEWIIYAYKKDGIYQTNSCTHSSSLPPREFQKQRVEDDLKFLKEVQEKKSALEFLNTNRRHFKNIVPGKHEEYDTYGYIDSLQVGFFSNKNAPGIKLFSTVFSREEDIEYVTVQELLLDDISEVRQKGNHLDLISGSDQGAENFQGEVRLCMDYINNENLKDVVNGLEKTSLSNKSSGN